MPVEELEQSIKPNGHLPGIPSAEEVAANGVSLGALQAKLFAEGRKVTLYVIDSKKENEQLKAYVTSLEN